MFALFARSYSRSKTCLTCRCASIRGIWICKASALVCFSSSAGSYAPRVADSVWSIHRNCGNTSREWSPRAEDPPAQDSDNQGMKAFTSLVHLIFWFNGWFGFLQSIQGKCLEHRDYLPLLHFVFLLRILVPCCLLLVQRTGYPCALRRRDLQRTYGISSRESVASPLELGHQIWQAGGYSSKLGYQFQTTDLDICFHMFSCLVPQSYFLGA